MINIFSLAIGIACCILIFSYVSHEFSFDRFHENADDIYQIYYKITSVENEEFQLALHPHTIVAELQNHYPAVRRVTTFQGTRALLEYEDKQFMEAFAKVDSSFLTMFSFPLIAGDAGTVLKSHDQIVISKKIADKLFDNIDQDYSKIIGKVITINGWREKKKYNVSGVLKEIPKNSSIQFGALMLFENNNLYSRSNNAFGELSAYVQLNAGTDPLDFEKSINRLKSNIFSKAITELREKNILKDSDDCFVLKVQPLSDVYFNQNIRSQYEATTSKLYSYVLIGIGLLIFVLACINFINLSIGQALNRTLEIGVRKVLGAGRKQIVLQYSIEKTLLILLALFIGYAMAEFLLPLFNQLAEKELSFSILNGMGIPVFLLLVLVLASFFAAGIPAIILSKLNPSGVFRAIMQLGGKTRVNSVLVIAQFFMSIVLLSSVFIMSEQISYMQNKDLGFDQEQIVVVPIAKKYSDIYKNKLNAYPDIINVAGCDRNFSNGSSSRIFYTVEGKPKQAYIIRTEETYLNTLGIKLLAGRNFSMDFPSDKSNSVIVNEVFVKEFGLSNPVNTIIRCERFAEGRPTIIGVVQDFHLFSMRQTLPPVIMHMTSEINGNWSLLIKIKPNHIRETIQKLEDIWKDTVPQRAFNYSFLDDNLNKKYLNEQRWQKITGISTIFAFIISSLGLLGLISIVTKQRTKEIGIRKVMGATIAGLFVILTRDITKWLLIANIVAWPVTFVIMNKWLDNYAYHIEIDWQIFVFSCAVSVIIALIVLSWHTFRAATQNPVQALRYE